MGVFSSEIDYDRTRILEAAARARSRKRYRRAAALYRRVLAVEPANLELHARLAPLLAATGRRFDAWRSFRRCAEAAVAEGRTEQAAALYREATRCLPYQLEAWEALAETERRRGRTREAFEVYLEARQRFRGRGRREEAIHLLREARDLVAWDPKLVVDLARLLTRTDQESEALLLLEELAERSWGADLRRVRTAQWRIAPTLGNSWRWVRATVSALGEEPAPAAATLSNR